MTDPTRWSDATSDADPVLRAVLRYAQQLEPSRQDVAACAAAVARAERPRSDPARVRPARRSFAWLGGIALVGAAGIALGMTLAPRFAPPRSATTALPSAPRTPVPPPLRLVPAPVVEAAPSAEAPVPVARPRVVVSNPPAPSAEPTDEVSLLAEARKQLRREPARALTLLTQHAQLFPSSSWTEERSALRIEALFAGGRGAEAQRELADFNTRFPTSIYRPRLQSAGGRRE